jgi:hypothetical protein
MLFVALAASLELPRESVKTLLIATLRVGFGDMGSIASLCMSHIDA